MADHTAHTKAFRAALEANPVKAGKFGNVDIIDRIFRVLAEGSFRCVAAEAAGVSEDSIGDWMKRGGGTEPVEPYTTFAEAVLAIEADTEADRVKKIAASADWKAQAWLLERKNRNRWGDSKHLELTGKDGAPLVSHDDLLSRLARLAAAGEAASTDPEPDPE